MNVPAACGTCETHVLDGDVDQREHRDMMYICVSRARSGRLVLDL
jgi:ferredoxin